LNGAAMAELAVDLSGVSKIYKGKIHALRGIAMNVRRGEIFGLLGPNGAGKSTLVKIMMTVIRPTSAQGTLLGNPVGHKPTLARVGYLPENHRFPKYLTGRQNLHFFGALAKVDRATRKKRSSELLEIVGMSADADRKVAGYSKGMMQRIGLAQTLVNEPDLVVLDEPTDGVDPGGRRQIRDVLARLREQGKTVFINSHLLSELELICDRVAILVGGQVARQGTLDELTLTNQHYQIELLLPDPIANRSKLLQSLPASFNGAAAEGSAPTFPQRAGSPPPPTVDRGTLNGGQSIEVQGALLRIGSTEPADIQPVLDALRREGYVIRRVQSFRPTLEDLFLSAVNNELPVLPPPPPGAFAVVSPHA
jgi:ABC-2 type transport system ATP-binding protein